MKTIFVFILSVPVISLAFWFIWGHNLRYDVYSNDVFWYDEEFSKRGKIIISCLVGLLGGGLASALFAIFCRMGHK